MTAGPYGALWYTERSSNKVARITAAGVLTNQYTDPIPGEGPNYIFAGPDGALWFSEQFGDNIARLTTAGEFTE